MHGLCLIFLYFLLYLVLVKISYIDSVIYRYVIIVNYLISIFSINLQINLRLIVLTINCSSFQVSNLLRTQYVILASFTLHQQLVSHYLVAIERLPHFIAGAVYAVKQTFSQDKRLKNSNFGPCIARDTIDNFQLNFL